MKVDTIRVERSKARQGKFYREYFHRGDRSGKLELYCDSYDFQSYARIYVWANDAWSEAASLHYSEMLFGRPIEQSAVQSSGTYDEKLDRLELLRLFVAIVEGKTH